MEVSRCDLLVQVVGARNVPLRVEVSDFHLHQNSFRKVYRTYMDSKNALLNN